MIFIKIFGIIACALFIALLFIPIYVIIALKFNYENTKRKKDWQFLLKMLYLHILELRTE